MTCRSGRTWSDPGPGPVTVTWQVAPLAGAAIEVELGGVCLETDCEPMTIVVPLDFDGAAKP